jgi:hypothetical protein
MPLEHKRHPQSLENVLDFSQPMTLAPNQSQTARLIFDRLMTHYGPGQVSCRRYKPAALIQAVFDNVSSKDLFLIFYFSFLYEACCPRTDDTQDMDNTHYLRFLEDFQSWDLDGLQNIRVATEDFAEYIVENLLLPRTIS